MEYIKNNLRSDNMKKISKDAKITPLILNEDDMDKLNMMALNSYKEDQLEFPKENDIIRFIDKDSNIDFQAKINRVKEGKTYLDTVLEIERL